MCIRDRNKKDSSDKLEKIINNEVQILVGTQLISKGFHFPSLNCIVVVDIELSSQVPYLHWADIFYNTYHWDGIDRDDIKGTKLGSELLLTPRLNLELAYDDKDKKGLKDEWYANIEFVHPPRNGPSLKDGLISSSTWREERDMSSELLTKVKRNNKIMVEIERSKAIEEAKKNSEEGDIVLIAGKGHEDYQILKNKVIKFDDFKIAKKIFNK